ncbi:MAG: hypothetical protein LBF67_03295 [Prevotellaceae bacterium]|jgi:hypothetical protein|nr:hypothetical protein [Prevotellaceae bacterium]
MVKENNKALIDSLKLQFDNYKEKQKNFPRYSEQWVECESKINNLQRQIKALQEELTEEVDLCKRNRIFNNKPKIKMRRGL